MAKNTTKRIPIKWVRDKAKSAYIKMPECYICATKEDLELHHTNGMQNMWDAWVAKNNYIVETDEHVVELREQFIAEHHTQIYIDVFTLCAQHHLKLHAVYGKSPPLVTAKKQVLWINKQKEKFLNKPTDTGTQKPSIWSKHLK